MNRRASLLSVAVAAVAGMAAGYMLAVHAGADTQPQARSAASTHAHATGSFALQGNERALAQSPARPASANPSLGDRRTSPLSADDVDRMLRDLQTLTYGDRRSFAEKLGDFLAEHPGRDGIAMASKGIADLADNRDVLSDRALQSIYARQKDPELRRVLAQVASMRGDNSLIEGYVAETGTGLRSADPATRRQALVQQARTHYAGAADMVAPMLQDEDANVVMEALLALRATGNQRHVRFAEELAGHPDESVSWLAMDVISQLQVFSPLARTNIAGNELTAELPAMPVAPPPPGCASANPVLAAR